MKKIIAAFDARKLSESTRDYAIYLAKEIQANVTGVFIENSPVTADSPLRTLDESKRINAGHKKDRKEVITSFETSCKKARVTCAVTREAFEPIHELLHESIYADIAVVNVNETFSEFRQAGQPRFISRLLAEVQCPLFVAPDEYKQADKIILLYDGSPSSVYAIKIFSSLFENQTKMETEILTVRSNDDELFMQSAKLIKEFMNRHYPHAGYTVIKGNPQEVIGEYLAKQSGNAIVVMGGHQQSSVLKSFKKTLADTLMAKLRFPLFIAPNK